MPPVKSIDFLHDVPDPRIDRMIHRLALLLTRLFFTEECFKNLTDCAWDNFYTITDRMEVPFGVEPIEHYKEEVLNWAFAECGRGGYDRIKEVLNKF